MNSNSLLYILIHSPLVGLLTWMPVADRLAQKRIRVSVPALSDTPDSNIPFWKQHALAVRRAVKPIISDKQLVLVAHSGAGSLLPAIANELGHPVAAFLFVDAGIPKDGASRIELMADESPERALAFRRFLEEGGHYPNWSEEDLGEEIPDEVLRQRLLAELQPRGLPYWEEKIPAPNWPGTPSAFLQFTPTYSPQANYARSAGWPFRELAGGHFKMLVEPESVANALVDLATACLAS